MRTSNRPSISPPEGPAVAIFRDQMLPISETFIIDQCRNMTRYGPILVGLRRSSPSLDLAPFPLQTIEQGRHIDVLPRLAHQFGRAPGDLSRRVAAYAPVLLHAHFGPDALNAQGLARRLAIPLVVTFHGYDITQSDSSLRFRRYLRRRRHLASSAAQIIVVSDFLRRRAISLGFPAEKVRTHYIGVDVRALIPQPLIGRGDFILAVGRLVEKKGFSFLLHAAARLKALHKRPKIVIIGTGPEQEHLRQLSDQLAVDVQWLGAQPHHEVIEWMKRARMLVIPSVVARDGDMEGLPLTLLEAGALGVPVVASRHSGIPEAITDDETGLLVDERDTHAIAAAIARLAEDDDLWTRLSKNARNSVAQHFDIRTQTARLEDIYDEVRDFR